MNTTRFKKLWKRRNVILIIPIAAALIFNLYQTQKKMASFLKTRRINNSYSPGLQFEPLKPYLDGVRRIGYYTDRPLDNGIAGRQLTQAYYFLAPTILDLLGVKKPKDMIGMSLLKEFERM